MTASSPYPQNPTFQCLSVRHRRELLRALSTWRPPLSEKKLAAYLAASSQREQSVNAEVTDALRIELKQSHLPALEAAGFITRNKDDAAVDTTDHPAFGDPRFERLLDIRSECTDVVFASLAHDYRRIILTVLEDTQSSMSRLDLAQQICRLSPDEASDDSQDVEAVRLSLHHIHLPRLDGSGLLTYDPGSGKATYESHPALERVFTVVYGREAPTVERLDGFFDGLADAYRQVRHETGTELAWPHFWRIPDHG